MIVGVIILTGHFQSIFGRINVIMMLGKRGARGQGRDVYFVHYCLKLWFLCRFFLLSSFSSDVKRVEDEGNLKLMSQ